MQLLKPRRAIGFDFNSILRHFPQKGLGGAKIKVTKFAPDGTEILRVGGRFPEITMGRKTNAGLRTPMRPAKEISEWRAL